jgi:hypothetical protein
VVEHDLRPLDVRHQRAHGLLHDQAHADGGGEVVDDVALVYELVDDCGREDRVDDEVEVAPFPQMGDVLGRPGGEVVECEHLPAAREQKLRQVGADEARSPRNQRFFRLLDASHGRR